MFQIKKKREMTTKTIFKNEETLEKGHLEVGVPVIENRITGNAANAIRLRQAAQRKRVYASETDPIHHACDMGEARDLDRQATALLIPQKPLKRGLGDEIIPPEGLGLTGLESTLKTPDNLALEATIQRTDLADKAGVFELAIEAAESAKAEGAVQKMICHQMAAAHRHAMRLLAESEAQRDSVEKCRMAATASKLIDAFSRAATALQRLQTGSSQVVTVQHVQINGGQTAIVGNFRGGQWKF